MMKSAATALVMASAAAFSGRISRVIAPTASHEGDTIVVVVSDSGRKASHSMPSSLPADGLVRIPFSAKVNGRIGTYRIGFWPGELRRITSRAYQNPDVFLEVTSQNLGTPVSPHFRLGDFLTHDQAEV